MNVSKLIQAVSIVGFAITANAGTMGQAAPAKSPIYLGLFGGAGSVNQMTVRQQGTAYIPPAGGGPLAVNAVGKASTNRSGVLGAHIGYQWNSLNSNAAWSVTPALELEGYYLGATATGHNLSNDNPRLGAHRFTVTYPMNTAVLLVNGVLALNNLQMGGLHPYIGGGIGAANVSITNADSSQFRPSEPGVNHYNSDKNASNWAFAAQAKAGLQFGLNEHVSVFAEYRYLYLASTTYTFGATQFGNHVPTSQWTVRMNGMSNNIGAVGIHYNV